MRRIDENHSFNRAIAGILGIEKAVLLKEIYGWCHVNLAKGHNVIEGLAYTRMSSAAFAEKFDYMSRPSVSRWLLEMEQGGWVVSASINERAYDKTKSYFVNYERYDAGVIGEGYTDEEAQKWALRVRGVLERFTGTISQTEQSIAQNDQWIAQTEQSIAQNEQPIPSLTHLLPTSTLKGTGNEKNEGAGALPVLALLGGLELKKAAKAEILNWITTNPAGQELWDDAKKTYGYAGEAGPIFFEWVGNQSDYVLRNWKDNIHKIGSYVSNKARTEYRAQAGKKYGSPPDVGAVPPPPVKGKEKAGTSYPRW